MAETLATARRLGEFIADTRWDHLSPELVAQAKDFALDTVGCIIGGSRKNRCRMVVDQIAQEGGAPHATVIGHGFKTSAMHAAYANGVMGHVLDFDDDHLEAALHMSTVVFPAVLALGEKLGASGKALLRAYILGNEVTARLGNAFLGNVSYKGFHATSICGVFGAAAAGAALLELDAAQTASALGLAGSFAAGNVKWQAGDSWHKPLQAGHAAMMGLLSASLAGKGFLGPLSVFDGPDGFIETHAHRGRFDDRFLHRDLGRVWEMTTAHIKLHACCGYGAAAIDCALALKRQGLRAEDIRTLIIRTFDVALDLLTKPEPQKRRPTTPVEAQFSLPYMVATAFCNGRAGAAQFETAALAQPKVVDLIDKIQWQACPEADQAFPQLYITEIEATLTDGRTLVEKLHHPKGGPDNPVSKDELYDKFDTLTAASLNKTQQTSTKSFFKDLESVTDIRTLAAHLG